MTEPTNEQLLAWLKGVENDLEGVNMMLPKNLREARHEDAFNPSPPYH